MIQTYVFNSIETHSSHQYVKVACIWSQKAFFIITAKEHALNLFINPQFNLCHFIYVQIPLAQVAENHKLTWMA